MRDVLVEKILELDQRSWFSGASAPPTCRDIARHAKLIEEANLEHPIILAADGRVMDGMHRVCKAWIQGCLTIKAVRFEHDPDPDHIDASLEDLPYDEPW